MGKRSMLRVAVVCTVGYAFYYLSMAVFLLGALPFLVLLSPFAEAKRALFLRIGHGYARLLTQLVLPRLGVCDIVEASGGDALAAGGSHILVANHRGRLDALLVMGLTKRTCVVVKARYVRFPLLAFLVRHSGFVSVDPSHPASVAAALRKCGDILASKTNLLIFPEGSRSTGDRLRRFGNLAFRLAVDHQVDVVPVVVYSRTAFMVKSMASFYPRAPVRYRIRVLEPFHPEARDTPVTLGDRVYRRMASELRTLAHDERQCNNDPHSSEGAGHGDGVEPRV